MRIKIVLVSAGRSNGDQVFSFFSLDFLGFFVLKEKCGDAFFLFWRLFFFFFASCFR